MAATTTTNTCKKCGCEDKFMPSPAPCPTPIGCPTPEPCSEVMDAQCVIYTGNVVECNEDAVILPNNTVAQALSNIVNYFCAAISNARPYEVYTALISQTNLNDPNTTILENGIGSIVWTRDAIGVYSGTLTGAFPIDKTALFIQDDVSLAKILINPRDTSIVRIDDDTIQIYTYDDTSTLDSVLNNTTIEIRVYN
jgi:hypothetical protein